MANPDHAAIEHYWRDGRSAMEIILGAMIRDEKTEFNNILDFPSGYGRIARHLVAAFPTAHVTACDIEEIMVATSWQSHTVRGAMAGALKKKLGLNVTSEKDDKRGRVYKIPAA